MLLPVLGLWEEHLSSQTYPVNIPLNLFYGGKTQSAAVLLFLKEMVYYDSGPLYPYSWQLTSGMCNNVIRRRY